MTGITAETLTRHELVGLAVEVVADADDRAGIHGVVVEETERTLRIGRDDRSWVVPKGDATFEFELPDGDRVRVEGAELIARPARRTESAGGSIWRSA